MRHEDWISIQEQLSVWKQHRFQSVRPTFDEWIEMIGKNFAEVAELVSAHTALNLSRQELTLAIALADLAPETSNPPPDWMWDSLYGQTNQFSQLSTGFEPDRYLEMVMAWGCGWGRPVPAKSKGWDGRWSPAILAFRALIERSIHHTIRLLTHILPYDEAMLDMGAAWQRSYAGLLCLELVHDQCSCGKHVQGCQLKNGQHGCGRNCCRPEHQLSNWRPDRHSLRAFVAQTVRGIASDDLRVGAFTNSTLYPRLSEDLGLVVGNVEFKVCHSCNSAVVAAARQEKKEVQGKNLVQYQNQSCHVCDTPIDLQQTYFKSRKNWLLIPYDRGGGYKLVERWRCPACRNLYSLVLGRCPLCQTPRPQRPTTVWVYDARLLNQWFSDLP